MNSGTKTPRTPLHARARLRILPALLLMGGVLPMSTGCGQIGAEMAEQAERQRHTKKFVFDDEPEKLWKEMVIVAREGGCVCPDELTVGETVKCEGDETAFARRWMNVRLTKVDGGHMLEMVNMSERKQDDQWSPQPGQRGHDLEFTLVSRLHPKKAAKIDEEAVSKRAAGQAAGENAGKVLKEVAKEAAKQELKGNAD